MKCLGVLLFFVGCLANGERDPGPTTTEPLFDDFSNIANNIRHIHPVDLINSLQEFLKGATQMEAPSAVQQQFKELDTDLEILKKLVGEAERGTEGAKEQLKYRLERILETCNKLAGLAGDKSSPELRKLLIALTQAAQDPEKANIVNIQHAIFEPLLTIVRDTINDPDVASEFRHISSKFEEAISSSNEAFENASTDEERAKILKNVLANIIRETRALPGIEDIPGSFDLVNNMIDSGKNFPSGNLIQNIFNDLNNIATKPPSHNVRGSVSTAAADTDAPLSTADENEDLGGLETD